MFIALRQTGPNDRREGTGADREEPKDLQELGHRGGLQALRKGFQTRGQGDKVPHKGGEGREPLLLPGSLLRTGEASEVPQVPRRRERKPVIPGHSQVVSAGSELPL